MSKKSRRPPIKYIYAIIIIIMIVLSVYILNTYPLFENMDPLQIHLSSQSYFQYTCYSFTSLCNKLQLSKIGTSYQLNLFCKSIFNKLSQNISHLNPLFVLSFRREYFFMLKKVTPNHSINSECNHLFIHNLFKPLHLSNFHHSNHSILYHTHISKALGTSVYFGLKEMAHNLGMHDNEIAQTIRRDLYDVKHSSYIFKGSIDKKTAFKGCEWLYNYLMNKTVTIPPLRVENEAPLTIHGICSKFYNSIILRDPIYHRLSMIAYQNMFDQKRVAIYCKNKTSLKWKMCDKLQEMKGFLSEIFDFDHNVGHKANLKRIQAQEMLKTVYNESLLVEYINPNENKRNFGIGYQFYRITNKAYQNFNTTQLFGWLTNTYIRWIGLNQLNIKLNDSLTDCMNINYLHLNQFHLFITNTILLQYDYVLPFDYRIFQMRHPIWHYYANEIEENILGRYKKENSQNFRMRWPRERDLKKQFEISTSSLEYLFKQTGELQLLIDRNKLDLDLFEFAKQIANVDIQFLKAIQ
eukprot:387708_1